MPAQPSNSFCEEGFIDAAILIHRPRRPLGPQSNMSEALALVRAGKLDAASRLLMEQMGASRAPATPPPAPRPSSPFSAKSEVGRAARLLRGACTAGEIIDVQAKPVPATVPDAPAAASSSGGKAAGDAPGAFARVPFQHGGAQHPYFLYTPSTPAPGPTAGAHAPRLRKTHRTSPVARA